MEAYHEKHRPHIKVGNDAEEEEELHLFICCVILFPALYFFPCRTVYSSGPIYRIISLAPRPLYQLLNVDGANRGNCLYRFRSGGRRLSKYSSPRARRYYDTDHGSAHLGHRAGPHGRWAPQRVKPHTCLPHRGSINMITWRGIAGLKLPGR